MASVQYTEVVRFDRLTYLAERESGRDYQKQSGEHAVHNYAREALNKGARIGECVHYCVQYSHGRNTPDFGRLNANGLQSIDGEFKRFLLEGLPAYDIDQANSHPTLMLQDARAWGRPMPTLEAYIENRADWLAQIVMDVPRCTRKDAKQLVLTLLYGGGIQSWEHDLGLKVPEDSETRDRLTELKMEFKRHVVWWDASEHSAAVRAADTLTDAELVHSHKNASFHRFSIAYQDKEMRATLVISDALSAHGLTTRVLCHDGLIVDGGIDLATGRPVDPGDAMVRSLLRVAETAVKEQMGYAIKLELKPLTPNTTWPFEQYVEQKWPALETPPAPMVDKKLGQDQDREFAEYLITMKRGRFFKERTGNGDDSLVVARWQPVDSGLGSDWWLVRRALRHVRVWIERRWCQAHSRLHDARVPIAHQNARVQPGAQRKAAVRGRRLLRCSDTRNGGDPARALRDDAVGQAATNCGR